MTKFAPEWVRTSDPVIRSPARYRWTTAPALMYSLKEVEGSCVYASTRGLEDGPVRPCDVIPVYVWMKEKFKDGLNKVTSGAETMGRCGGHAHQWTIDR